MYEMTETQMEYKRSTVTLNEEEQRALLSYWIDQELGTEMWEYNTDQTCGRGNRVKTRARARQEALAALMTPMEVAVELRDVCVRLWSKAVEISRSGRQPLGFESVTRIHAENEAARSLPRTEEFFPDPRGYFAFLAPVLFEAVAAQIRTSLTGPCDCGPDLTAGEDSLSKTPRSPNHRCERVASLNAADAALAALAKWHAQQRISE